MADSEEYAMILYRDFGVDAVQARKASEWLARKQQSAVAAEREACAKECDKLVGKIYTDWHMDDVLRHCAHAIRNKQAG